MDRSTVKAIGLLIFIPFVVLGLSPWLAGSTNMLDSFPDFTWIVRGITIVEFAHASNGQPHALVSPLVWVVAGLGELILVALAVLAPKRANSHILKIH